MRKPGGGMLTGAARRTDEIERALARAPGPDPPPPEIAAIAPGPSPRTPAATQAPQPPREVAATALGPSDVTQASIEAGAPIAALQTGGAIARTSPHRRLARP